MCSLSILFNACMSLTFVDQLCTLVLCSPIVAAWKGASLMAARPEYHSWAVSKAEYEEDGTLRCRQRCIPVVFLRFFWCGW